MNELEYSEFVQSKLKPSNLIFANFSNQKIDLMHACLLLASESGELIDSIKKHLIYGKPLDYVNLKEELGDLEFTLTFLYDSLNITRGQAIESNVTKLYLRYPDGYSDQAATDRADKL